MSPDYLANYAACSRVHGLVSAREGWHPSVDILTYNRLLRALVHSGISLRLRISIKEIDNARRIHESLKSISLPAKDVISIGSITSRIAKRPSKRLGSVRGPISLIIESLRIPDDLEQDLGGAYGMASWAWSLALEGSVRGIRHV